MSSAVFTGSSSFVADLQGVITRAVSIATLPITLLKSARTELEDQATVIASLRKAFQALQTSAASISSAMGEGSFEAQVSDTHVASASLGTGASEGCYSIDVSDVGAYAASLSASSWTQTSGEHSYKVKIGAEEIDIDPADSSAAAVAAAINAAAGTKVRAMLVNVGSISSPDYRISLQSLTLGDNAVDILDNGVSMQTQKTTGRKAQYMVDNSGITVESESRSVKIAEGLTVTLLADGTGHADITVTRSTSALGEALSNFADAYNSLATALDGQRGESGGALSGQSLVYDLQDTLSNLAGYSSSDLACGLEDLGLTVDASGSMTFNPYKLMATDLTNSSGLTTFLGSAETGGFLKTVIDGLRAVLDPDTGILPTAENAVTEEIDDIASRMDEKQSAVDELQTRLTEQMAKADSAIASMEQRYSYLYSLFSAMKQNSESYQ